MRTFLVLLILVTSLCGAGFLILLDWQRLPTRSENIKPSIDVLAETHQAQTLDELAATLQAGQGSLLSADQAVLQLPQTENEPASELKAIFSKPLTIERQLSLIPPVSERISQIVTHSPDLMDTVLGEPSMEDYLRNNPDPQVKQGVADVLLMFGDQPDHEIANATIRRAIILAITAQVRGEFESGNYDPCIDLCDRLLKQLQDAPMQDAVRQIKIYRLRSQERRAWAAIRPALLHAKNSILSPSDLAALKKYISDFHDTRFKVIEIFFKDRFARAKCVSEWNDLIIEHTLHDVIANNPNPNTPTEISSIYAPIIALHRFYKAYPETSESELAKRTATELLKQHFDIALQPLRKEQKRVEFVLQRSGSKHEGIIDTDTKHRTTLAPQHEPKEKNRNHFFTAAIQGEPRVVDAFLQEADYRSEFRTARTAVAQHTWSPAVYAIFSSTLTGNKAKRGRRKADLQLIANLVKKCTAFQNPNNPPGN